MVLRSFFTAIALAASVALVAACDTSEERAEKHYQSALAYLEAGDVDRAVVEFRNVFKLNGRHKEARRSLARAERDRGRFREAFSQYLRLVEEYPDDPEGLHALAEIAAMGGEWETAIRYVDTALVQAPDNLELQAIKAVADYGLAADTGDSATVVSSVAAAQKLRHELPGNLMLRRVIIDDLIRAQRNEAALTEIESAMEIAPDDRGLYAQRLSIYAALGDDAAVESGLLDMVTRFPDAQEMKVALVRWYVSRNELDKAEAHLRRQIAPASGDPAPVLELVRFLAEYRGPNMAVNELERNITATDPNPVFRSARAGFLFDLGRRAESIAEMRSILETAQSSEESRRIKVGLARMLTVDGNAVGARMLVEEVLAEDAGDVEALKMQAGWLILGDETGEAISVLRRALDQNPRDPSIMTLMAQAYERDGNRDLMREMLALAVEASGKAPDASLRYAQLLASEGKFIPAERVLIDALRIAPGNAALLVPLGQIYLQVNDWPRATTVIQQLESLGDKANTGIVAGLRAGLLAGQKQTSEAIGYLENLVAEGSGGIDAKIAIIRTHLANGKDQEALAYSAKLLAENPDDPALRFIDASVRSLTGDPVTAEATYRALIAEDPQRLPAWMALFRLIAADNARWDEVDNLVDQALAIQPESGELRWAKAGLLERSGDFEGAIAIYEALYRENSANPIVANNLASLISNHRHDAASLARAEIVARRLRGSTVAAYQDTFGWISFQRGNYAEALEELKSAAKGLPKDANVQYHLAMAYLAVDLKPEALDRFRRALALVSAEDNSEFVRSARDEVSKLEALGVTTID